MRSRSLVILSALATCVAGCSDTSSTTPTASRSAAPAESTKAPTSASSEVQWAIASVADGFMRAILSGDVTAASKLLTVKAAQQYAMDPSVLSTVGMAAERVEVGEVRLLNSDEAAAQCLIQPTESEATVELCCLLKRDTDGWRVCGIASETDAESPTVISFEGLPAVSPEQLAKEDDQQPAAPRTASQPGAAERR